MKNRTDKGSRLTKELLRQAILAEGLTESSLDLFTYRETGSTNAEAMIHGETGGGAALFIAERQTAGRGRLGRSFLSPEGGLYMSLLLHPEPGISDFASVTARCAVAVCRAVEELTALSCGIKWVNDVYVQGRKLAGILTQGRTRDDGSLDFAVIGIGINLATQDLGEELRDIAISTEEAGGGIPDRCTLAAKIIRELFSVLDAGTYPAVLDEYRRRSILNGKEVRVITAGGEYTAGVRGIDGGFRLLLERDGEIFPLSTGEVSVRETGK